MDIRIHAAGDAGGEICDNGFMFSTIPQPVEFRATRSRKRIANEVWLRVPPDHPQPAPAGHPNGTTGRPSRHNDGEARSSQNRPPSPPQTPPEDRRKPRTAPPSPPGDHTGPENPVRPKWPFHPRPPPGMAHQGHRTPRRGPTDPGDGPETRKPGESPGKSILGTFYAPVTPADPNPKSKNRRTPT